MYNVFIDSDIILDFLSERKPFFKDAKQILTYASLKKIKLHTSAIIYANVFYVLRKEFSPAMVKSRLIDLSEMIQIVNTTHDSTKNALHSDFSDFENAIQYYTALENKCAFLITRNLKDFGKAKNIRVLTSAQFCKLFVK
ncbi:MAG: PIN domain-containing protein [Sphingobacteriales bacterium]|nr:PIN domain-containing protein [Sphingobacteriales bacterium]